MTLTSLNFLLFLGILIILYYVLPHKIQWIVLLVASYIFYYFAGGLSCFAFILFTTITTYLATYLMDKNNKKTAKILENEELEKAQRKAIKAQNKKKNRVWLIVVLVVNFVILFFCKACLVNPLHDALSGSQISFLTIGLPMGISFYMFQSMGYVIDAYRSKAIIEKNFFKVMLFTSFFPQLIQGPISQFEMLKETLFAEHEFSRKQVAYGLQRMLWGFFKKLVIADRIAVAIGTLKAPEYTGVSFFILTIFYAIQIYGDFTGGIDIAIGAAQTLGVVLPENFIRPFFSKNIAEYWRRWHISLNEWMKRYIFYPITVAKPMLKLSTRARKKLGKVGMRIPVYIGAVLTWLGTGIWHGFNLHFVIWGLLNCVIIVISEECSPLYEKFHERFPWSNKRGYDIWQIIRMFLLMNLVRATDLFENVGEYFSKIGSLFYEFNFHVLWDGTMMNLGLSIADYIIIGFGVIVMFIFSVVERKGDVRDQLQDKSKVLRYIIFIALLLVVIVFGTYGIGYDAGSFIYNQF